MTEIRRTAAKRSGASVFVPGRTLKLGLITLAFVASALVVMAFAAYLHLSQA
jgi:hypothetical protein